MNKQGGRIVHHAERCVSCFTCEVACKQEHDLPVGTYWVKVFRTGPYFKNGRLAMDYSIRQCHHCDEPKCLTACPEEAIHKRPDGLVLVREEFCSGCEVCLEACPFNAMAFDEEEQVAFKCTMCVHLLDQGAVPSCVKHCPTHALELTH